MTTNTTRVDRPAGPPTQLLNLVRRHELVAYFALAYAICAGAALTYTAIPALPHAPFRIVTVFSPTIAAVFVSWIIGCSREARRLLGGFTRWRLGWPGTSRDTCSRSALLP